MSWGGMDSCAGFLRRGGGEKVFFNACFNNESTKDTSLSAVVHHMHIKIAICLAWTLQKRTDKSIINAFSPNLRV